MHFGHDNTIWCYKTKIQLLKLPDIIFQPSKDNISEDVVSTKGKVNFMKKPSIERRDRERISSITYQDALDHVMYNTSDDYSDRILMHSPTLSISDDLAMHVMLDEDPFDYDIVNIDVSLLTIGAFSSLECL